MKIALNDALKSLAATPGEVLVKLFEHGSMYIEYYKPPEVDKQSPHTQDEIYVVAAGQGEFVKAAERYQFVTGDVLFVPAGVPHHFENYSADFATWVIFYGPQGGEASLQVAGPAT